MSEEEIDELERRVEELEALMFEKPDGHILPVQPETPQRQLPAWDALNELENKVAELENVLNPDEGALFAVGAECLAFSIADGAWMEAIIEERPSGAGKKTFVVRFVESGQKRSVVADQLRPVTVDLAAVSSLEESVRLLALNRLPMSDDLTGAPFPLAVPLTSDAQQAIIFDAEEELVRSAQCIEAMFKAPLRLASVIDSKPLAEMPLHTAPLLRFEQQVEVDMQRASLLSAESRKLIDRYGEIVSLLNEKMVAWDDVGSSS